METPAVIRDMAIHHMVVDTQEDPPTGVDLTKRTQIVEMAIHLEQEPLEIMLQHHHQI